MVREHDQTDLPTGDVMVAVDLWLARMRLKGLYVLAHPFKSLIKCGAVLPSQMKVARFP